MIKNIISAFFISDTLLRLGPDISAIEPIGHVIICMYYTIDTINNIVQTVDNKNKCTRERCI